MLTIDGLSPRMVLALWRRGVVGAIMYRNGATRLPLLVKAYAVCSVELRLAQLGHASVERLPFCGVVTLESRLSQSSQSWISCHSLEHFFCERRTFIVGDTEDTPCESSPSIKARTMRSGF